MALSCAFVFSRAALALPEDAEQDIVADAHTSDIDLNLGLITYYGTAEDPASISQGSMLITGTEIRIQRQEGELRSVIAIGTPARFQQQPEHDQPLLHASGLTLTFDNAQQQISIVDQAEFRQGRDSFSSSRIDYDLQGRRISAGSSPDGERVQMIISPRQNGESTPSDTPVTTPAQD